MIDDEGVTVTTEPQSWALIGTFSAAIFGMLTLFSVMLTRVIRGELGALEARLTARIDLLDRDIHVIARRKFPEVE